MINLLIKQKNWSFHISKYILVKGLDSELVKENWAVMEESVVKYIIKITSYNYQNENSYWKPEILLNFIAARGNLLVACACP